MKNIIIILILFLIIILQSALYTHLNIGGAFPNLILLIVLTLFLTSGNKKGIFAAIFGGILLDLFSFNNPIGISIFGLLFTLLIVYFFSQNTFKKTGFFSLLILGTISTISFELFLFLFSLIFKMGGKNTVIFFLVQIIYNLILLIPIFYAAKKIKIVFPQQNEFK